MFCCAEIHFREKLKSYVTKIPVEEIAHNLMKTLILLFCFSAIRGAADQKIEKETTLNFLEQIISVFIKLRVLSYTKDLVQSLKIASKKNKSRSLRTEIVRASNSLYLSH